MDLLPARSGGRKTSYRYADIGLQFAASIGVFTYAGYWADQNWGTRPWLLIVGVFLGFGLGMMSMMAKIAKLSSRAEKQNQPGTSAKHEESGQPAANNPPQTKLPPDP